MGQQAFGVNLRQYNRFTLYLEEEKSKKHEITTLSKNTVEVRPGSMKIENFCTIFKVIKNWNILKRVTLKIRSTKCEKKRKRKNISQHRVRTIMIFIAARPLSTIRLCFQ